MIISPAMEFDLIRLRLFIFGVYLCFQNNSPCYRKEKISFSFPISAFSFQK